MFFSFNFSLTASLTAGELQFAINDSSVYKQVNFDCKKKKQHFDVQVSQV
jgi:hypothetical protein